MPGRTERLHHGKNYDEWVGRGKGDVRGEGQLRLINGEEGGGAVQIVGRTARSVEQLRRYLRCNRGRQERR